MILLIPVDEKSYEDAKIVPLVDKECWMAVEMNQGYVKKYLFCDNRDDMKEFIDYVIIKSKDEDIEEFLDEGIEILVAPLQIYVENVVEAYKFRELHEL